MCCGNVLPIVVVDYHLWRSFRSYILGDKYIDLNSLNFLEKTSQVIYR